MPPVRDDATDGNTAQWEKVRAMRADKGEGSHGTPITVVGMPTAETPPADPPAPDDKSSVTPEGTQPRNPDGTFAAKTEDAPPPAAVAPKPETPATPPAPNTREVTIDGVKVQVSPELADAFERAEQIKTSTAKENDRETLKAELREELKKELAPPAKSASELAAEQALRDAEEARNAPKQPDAKLLIENPEEWQTQNSAYQTYLIERAKRDAKRETMQELQTQQQTAARDAEAHARGVLREQFYSNYAVLKDSADIVDTMLTTAMDDVIASGKLNRPLKPAEQEALKKELFADVAAKATRRLVQLMSGAKKVAPPVEAPKPPTVVSSAPAKSPKPPQEAPAEKAKYPKGSVSAALAERRAKIAGSAA